MSEVPFEDFGVAGLAPVQRDGKWGWIDRTGALVIPCEWEEVSRFSESGLASAKRGGKWGWIDRTGALAIPCDWEMADEFDSSGWARVHRGDKWGFVTLSGKPAIPCEWDGLFQFDKHGWARAERNGLWGWIDRTEATMLPFVWQQAADFDEHGHAWVHRPDAFNYQGFLDRAGREVTPCIFDWVLTDGHGFMHAELRGRYEIRDPQGHLIWKSDLHALRFLLPWQASFFGLLASLCVWRGRPQCAKEVPP